MGVLFGSQSAPTGGGSIFGDWQRHLDLWEPPVVSRSYGDLSKTDKDDLAASVATSMGRKAPKLATPEELSKLTPSKNYKNPIEELTNPLLDPIRRTGDAVRQLTGQADAELNEIDRKLRERIISNEEAMRQRQEILDRRAWVGTRTDTTENIKKALGVGVGVASTFAPGVNIVKGASVPAKMANATAQGVLFGAGGTLGEDLALEGKVDAGNLAMGAAAGGALGAGLGALGLGVQKLLKETPTAFKGATDSLKERIPEVRAADDSVISTQSMATTERKQKLKNVPASARDSLLDRYAPVKDLVKQLTGKTVDAKDDPYQLLKLRAGAEGQVYQYLEDNASWLKGLPRELRKDGDAYGYSKQFLSQATKRTPEQLEKAQRTINELSQKYGGDLTQLDEYTKQVRQSFDPLLDKMVEEKMVTPKRAAELKSNPDYFAKMEVLQDELDPNKFATGSVNTRRLEALLSIKGQSKDARIAHSSEALVKQTIRAVANIANNKVVKSLARIADESDNGVVLRPKGNTFPEGKLPKDYKRLSYIEGGKRFEIAVPKEVADVLNGANTETFDIVTSAMGSINNAFRQAVTTYNPLFVFFRNPARDFKSFMTNSRYVPVRRAVWDYSTALMDSLTNGKWSKEFRRSGGGQAGYFSREGGHTERQIAKIAKGLAVKRTIIGRIVTSPRDFMQRAAEVIEQAPRLAEYRAAVKSGQSAERAAVAGREVTVDFAQGGNFTKVLNQWIPFLNARTQGIRRTATAFKENPKRALTVYAATTALPMATLMWWNRSNFTHVWEQIPDYEKQNNFIFVLGDEKDASGRFTQIIKVPKGDVDKILGNTFETILDQFAGKNNDDLGQAIGASLTAAASNVSPVSFESDGKFSSSQVLSQALPPFVKAPIQAVSNYDLFKEAPVVPESLKGAPTNEQVRDDTPQLARLVGSAFNISPIKVENFINSLAGNVPFDVTGEGNFGAERFGKGISGVAGEKAKNDFYSVYGPARDARDYRERQIYKLIDSGKYGEAQRRADEFNRDLDKRFSPYFKENGAYATSDIIGRDPIDMISDLKLNVVISKKGKAYIKR